MGADRARTVRVVVVDQDLLTRSALAHLLATVPDIDVVAQASDEEAVVQCTGELRPDLLLVGMDGADSMNVDLIRAIALRRPGARILGLTARPNSFSIISGLRAGASGILARDSHPSALFDAIRTVCDGHHVLSQQVLDSLVKTLREGGRGVSHIPIKPGEELSARERAVVDLLAQGKSNAEIAGELHLSQATVKAHLSNVMVKWNVRDRVQVLVRAARSSVVQFR